MDQLYEIEDLLNVLSIDIEDYARISDGDITYFIFSSCNLEPEQEETLQNLEIDRWNGIYCSKKTEYDLNEILEIVEPIFSDLENSLWKNIIKMFQLINQKHYLKTEYHLFNFNELILTVIKWNGKITVKESDFNDFVNDLNIMIRFSCKQDDQFLIDEKYMQHPFWRDLATIRNKNSHYSMEKGYKFAIKQAERQKEVFKKYIDKEIPDSNIDFIKLQIKLLENCDEFLDDLLGDL